MQQSTETDFAFQIVLLILYLLMKLFQKCFKYKWLLSERCIKRHMCPPSVSKHMTPQAEAQSEQDLSQSDTQSWQGRHTRGYERHIN